MSCEKKKIGYSIKLKPRQEEKLWLASLQVKKLETEKEQYGLEISFSLVKWPNKWNADKESL